MTTVRNGGLRTGRTLRWLHDPYGLALACTYRLADGRGGGGKGYPALCAPELLARNVSLDKARRLLCRSKEYGTNQLGRPVSSQGKIAYDSMGLKNISVLPRSY